jgi:hypothetical protein
MLMKWASSSARQPSGRGPTPTATWTAEDGSARSVVEVVRGAGAKPAVGEGDHNQDDEVLAVSALGVRARPVLAIHGALLRRPLTARGVLVVSPYRLPHLLGSSVGSS